MFTERFGQHDSHPDVDEGVPAAAKTLEALGCTLGDLSSLGMSAVSRSGAPSRPKVSIRRWSTARVSAANVEGVYPVSIAARLPTIRDRANELPHTVKVTILLGGYTDHYY